MATALGPGRLTSEGSLVRTQLRPRIWQVTCGDVAVASEFPLAGGAGRFRRVLFGPACFKPWPGVMWCGGVRQQSVTSRLYVIIFDVGWWQEVWGWRVAVVTAGWLILFWAGCEQVGTRLALGPEPVALGGRKRLCGCSELRRSPGRGVADCRWPGWPAAGPSRGPL